jgi:hypothetical protein
VSEAKFNPDDPLFRVSRAIDDDLPEGDRRGLHDVLEASPNLRTEAADLRKVDELVRRWAASEVDMDWERFTESVLAMSVSDAEAAQLEQVDALVRRWGEARPQLDWTAFTGDVLAEIDSRRQRDASSIRLLLQIGLPLAAAAAVVFAVMTFSPDRATVPINGTRPLAGAAPPPDSFAPMMMPEAARPTRIASIAIGKGLDRTSRASGPIEPPKSAVSFGKELPDDCEMGPRASDIAMIAVSSESIPTGREDYPSL